MTRKNWDLKQMILFEDPHLLVINKAAGLLSQGAEEGEDNLVDLLRVYLGRPYVGLVHRLDRNTSGLMVVAKRSKSAERLTESLKSGELERKYLALVHGDLPEGSILELKHWLLKDEKTNKASVSKNKREGAKEASLRLKVLASGSFQKSPLSLVEVELQTGRSHQIRAQLSFEGFPLLGDSKYGAPNGFFDRTALHSYWIKFPHPKLGEAPVEFKTQVPSDFKKVLEKAGLVGF